MDEDTICDLCNLELDHNLEYTTALNCGFKLCGKHVYHTSCLETYLKQHAQKGRMAGFSCPRGKGKGINNENPCGKKDIKIVCQICGNF